MVLNDIMLIFNGVNVSFKIYETDLEATPNLMNILLSFFLQRKHKSLKKKSRTYVSVELVLDGALIFPLYILYVYFFFFGEKKYLATLFKY